jgi:uncharacterized protein (DUF2252 family)
VKSPDDTVAARAARGRAARKQVPRTSQAEWVAADNRSDPVSILEEQGRTRIPELLPIRYSRMAVAPFTFFRGAAGIMAADLAAGPRSGLTAQLCGDAHLSNFGAFASPERRLVFDINDFDETLPGPWEWDLKRLATSLEVAGRDRGFTAPQRRTTLVAAAAEYRQRMKEAAASRTLDVWYAHDAVDDLLELYGAEMKVAPGGRKEVKAVEKSIAKTRSRDSLQAFGKLTREVDGHRRIVADPPLIVPIADLVPPGVRRDQIESAMRDLMRSYGRSLETDRRHLLDGFSYVDMARKVVGVGSVGTGAWVVLMVGRDDADPLLLQAKQAEPSVLERFVGKSRYRNHGQRVVAGQRLMQAVSDIFLGWQRVPAQDGTHRDFYVRQLRDWKGSADVGAMSASSMVLYARLCAAALARAHARSGDPIAIAAYLGAGDVFDRAVTGFAAMYADQNETDYAEFLAAVKSGRLPAEE